MEGVKAQLVQVFWDWEHWWAWKGLAGVNLGDLGLIDGEKLGRVWVCVGGWVWWQLLERCSLPRCGVRDGDALR